MKYAKLGKNRGEMVLALEISVVDCCSFFLSSLILRRNIFSHLSGSEEEEAARSG